MMAIHEKHIDNTKVGLHNQNVCSIQQRIVALSFEKKEIDGEFLCLEKRRLVCMKDT